MLSTVLPVLRLGLMDLKDQASIAIVDLSSYAILPTGSQLAMQITPPGYDTVNVSFTAGGINIYKCADLGITCTVTDCCPLPDGIYDVQYTVIPIPGQQSTIEKTFVKIDQIKCKFQNMFLKIDLECNCGHDSQKQYKKEIKGIDLLIAGCVSEANNCNIVLAQSLYQKADDLLNNMCCKFNLTCNQPYSCPPCQ